MFPILSDLIASPCSARAREERRFKVLVKIAARVDLYRLDEYLGGRLPEAPQEALQALDIVLREQATIRQAAARRRSYLELIISTAFWTSSNVFVRESRF
jgi:hypothetical protein